MPRNDEESGRKTVNAVGLVPTAVTPNFQTTAIGYSPVKAGLKEIQELGHKIVVVLGHPEFYCRFGFLPSKQFGIRWEVDVPDEVLMVTELSTDALKRVSGTVKYRPDFNEV